MRFTKMHGAGNDYVYLDCFNQPAPDDPADLARRVSDRHFGIGSDGLILILPSEKADARMRMFNADGSEAEMCGNGIRCVAKYVYDHELCRRDHLSVETGNGVLSLELEIEQGRARRVRVDMGEPILRHDEIPTTLPARPTDGEPLVIDAPLLVGDRRLEVTCVSMGNPHCVTYVEELSDEWVFGVGPEIERHEHFPRRTNAEFVEVVGPQELRMRVWERGSGETLACGTGACAVCVAGVLSGRSERRVVIHLLGGDLELEWDEPSNRVFMTGSAVEVFSGDWNGGND